MPRDGLTPTGGPQLRDGPPVRSRQRSGPGRRPGPARRRTDGGYATVETAVALPALVLLAAMLVWGVVAASAQIRCVDAARVGARAAARGDPDAAAQARSAAPPGASVEVSGDARVVRVTVAALCPGPGRLAAALSLRLGAEAVAAREDTLTGGGAEAGP